MVYKGRERVRSNWVKGRKSEQGEEEAVQNNFNNVNRIGGNGPSSGLMIQWLHRWNGKLPIQGGQRTSLPGSRPAESYNQCTCNVTYSVNLHNSRFYVCAPPFCGDDLTLPARFSFFWSKKRSRPCFYLFYFRNCLKVSISLIGSNLEVRQVALEASRGTSRACIVERAKQDLADEWYILLSIA